MNKTDKLMAMLLGLALAGWLWHSMSEQNKAAAAAREAGVAAATNAPAAAVAQAVTNVAAAAEMAAATKVETPRGADLKKKERAPEKTALLENAEAAVTVSTHGGAVTRVVLKEFAEKPGALSAENPAVTLDFAAAPALALEGVPGGTAEDDWELVTSGPDGAVLRSVAQREGVPCVTRRITLQAGYRLAVEDVFAPGVRGEGAKGGCGLSLGAMSLGVSKNDLLSIDSWLLKNAKGKPEVEHHGETEPLKSYLAGSSGGCSGSKSAEGMPAVSTVDVPGARAWIAVKNRFFVTAVTGLANNTGFRATAVRDTSASDYRLRSVAATAAFAEIPEKASYTLYVGPKRQALLWDLGMKDVMEFGMWRWVCYPMVWVLNVFHSWIPNYGVAIILLTLLVRLVFWPLTHKSTVSMRRMSEIQPKIKEIQAKFKGNPQRLQQETFACYRENKVNPMASCLPMLVQIPVFIALFTVLRAAVELRYAPFLWIADLSEPEALGATSWFPFFGGLNILPILMAATMALQSALTPSTGDKAQQRMMMVMMPAMMLFMFYSFPSALSLYWTLSQVLSIVQMWWIRRKYTPAPVKAGVLEPDAVEMPQTRQMRRHG